MIKKLIVLLFISNCSILYAQTIKTDVLVIGGSPSGIAAALQSARSKVKTILAVQTPSLIELSAGGKITIEIPNGIASGIWDEFRIRVQNIWAKTPGHDTSLNAPVRFEPKVGDSVLKEMTDTVKKLSIYLDAPPTAIKRNGDYWDVNLVQHGKNILIKTRVVVDATEMGEVAHMAGVKLPARFDNYIDNGGTAYRTSIAAGAELPVYAEGKSKTPTKNYPPYPAYYLPISAVVLPDADNLLLTERLLPGNKNIYFLPLQLELGQGVGTVAAYCAFFKTTTKNLKVRVIQGELLDFKGRLLPFADISQKDPNWRAIQQVCGTGLLKGKRQIIGAAIVFVFEPDSLVSTADIKPVLTEIYTRAFLWFNKEKPAEKFTVGNMISFMSDLTLTDADLMKASVQKAWKTQYKFKSGFDMQHQITRREFAVLVNKYLNPFARTVDLSGRLVN
jgi:hypothetical protein